eukprot:3935868-Rhodomonas_salina.2
MITFAKAEYHTTISALPSHAKHMHHSPGPAHSWLRKKKPFPLSVHLGEATHQFLRGGALGCGRRHAPPPGSPGHGGGL